MGDSQTYLNQIDAFIAELSNDLVNSVIDADIAESYADFFGRTLSRKVTATLAIYADVEVDLPFATDTDDFGDNLRVELSAAGWDSDITILDYDVTSIVITHATEECK